jgi:hypothetical protein
VVYQFGELSHESNCSFDPCVRHHRGKRHGDSRCSDHPAAACGSRRTVHRPQLLAAQIAHQAQTGAPRDPSAGLVTEARPAPSRRDGGVHPAPSSATPSAPARLHNAANPDQERLRPFACANVDDNGHSAGAAAGNCARARPAKVVNRFCEKDMLKQSDRAG